MLCMKCRQRGSFNYHIMTEDRRVLVHRACSKCASKFATSVGGYVLRWDDKKGVWF